MKIKELSAQQVLSGDFDKYLIRIGNDNYYTETTVFDFKAALHYLRSFKKAYGEPEFAHIGKNPKYKGDIETITIP